jgi:hypothetical protein
VLKHLPGCVRDTLYLLIDQLDWKITYDALEVYVRASAAEDVENMFAQCFVSIHNGLAPPRLSRFRQ